VPRCYPFQWRPNVRILAREEISESGCSSTLIAGSHLLGDLNLGLMRWKKLFWLPGAITPGLGPMTLSWGAKRMDRHHLELKWFRVVMLSLIGNPQPGTLKEWCVIWALKGRYVCLQSIAISEILRRHWHCFAPVRTHRRTNAYLSGGFVLFVPWTYYQSSSKGEQVPIQVWEVFTTLSQTRNRHQYPLLRR